MPFTAGRIVEQAGTVLAYELEANKLTVEDVTDDKGVMPGIMHDENGVKSGYVADLAADIGHALITDQSGGANQKAVGIFLETGKIIVPN